MEGRNFMKNCTFTKRLWAWFIVVSMFTALVPQISAAENLGEQNFLLGQKAYAGDTNSKDVAFYSDYQGERKWAYVSDNTSGGVTVNVGFLQTLCKKEGERTIIKLKVDRPGTYSVSLYALCRSVSAIAGLYLFPKNQESTENPDAYLTDTYKIGEADLYAPSNEDRTEQVGSVVIDEAGEYYLAFRADGKNSKSTSYYMYLRSLTMVDQTLLDRVEISAEQENLEKGGRTKISARAYRKNGEEIPSDTDNLNIRYESAQPEIVSVDEEGNALALDYGSAELKAFVSMGGIERQGSIVITVEDRSEFLDIRCRVPESLLVGEQEDIQVDAVMASGNYLSLQKSAFSCEILTSDPEQAAEFTDGAVRGLRVGRVTYQIRVNFRDREIVSDPLSLRVLPASEQAESGYQLFKLWLGAYSGDPTGNTDITPYLTYQGERKWVYVTCRSTSETPVKIYATGYLQMLAKMPGEWHLLKLKIDAPGTYRISAKTLIREGAGIAGLYLFPVNAQTAAAPEAYATEETKIGEVDLYRNTPEEGDMRESVAGRITVPEAGEYYLMLRADGKNPASSGYYMYFNQLLFEEERSVDRVELNIPQQALLPGGSVQAELRAYQLNGEEIDLENEQVRVSFESMNSAVARVDAAGVITGVGIGTAEIVASVTYKGISRQASASITVDDPTSAVGAALRSPGSIWINEAVTLTAQVLLESGNRMDVPPEDANFTLVSCEPEGAAVLEGNQLTGVAEGKAHIRTSVTFRGQQLEAEEETIYILMPGKTQASYWTNEKREIIQENIQQYDWARTLRNSAVKKAEPFLNQENALWDMIAAEGLPRYYYIGHKNDPNKQTCPYPDCQTDLLAKYGSYPWLTDGLTSPWKIQCPECRRKFPSNDFGAYYASGRNEYGVFDPELADKSLLVNTLYPELGEGWGVDDGFGYKTGNKIGSSNIDETKYFIAYFQHKGLYHGTGTYQKLLNDVVDAYLYTGEAKYGRVGAIVVDRLADVYPSYDWALWKDMRSDNYRGKLLDSTQETGWSQKVALAYDVFYPMYDDSTVVKYLSEKARTYQMENPKTSPALIRKNVEDNFLRVALQAAVDTQIGGNFGMEQASVAILAAVLDTMPESKEWMDWLMRPGERYDDPRLGGNVLKQLLEVVDRDGMGNESSPSYNAGWLTNTLAMAEYVYDYKKYSGNREIADLYDNPKFAKMFTATLPLIMAGYYTAQIGDYGLAAGTEIYGDPDTMLTGFRRLGDARFAQIAYLLNNNTVQGLHEPIWVRDPERIQKDIQQVIDSDGTWSTGSETLAAYGFSVLRDGEFYPATGGQEEYNTQRDFWMYYGYGTSHKQSDALNLGLDAFGLNMAPDLGYPEAANAYPNRFQWVASTLSHNTVMVNGRSQDRPTTPVNTPLHFDDSGRVKVMEAEALSSYPEISDYRRTVVMVEAANGVAYGVDFFRVLGGDDHIYSFHTQSNQISSTQGLTLLPQVNEQGEYTGTYAGPEVPWGEDPDTDPNLITTDYLRFPPALLGWTMYAAIRIRSASLLWILKSRISTGLSVILRTSIFG